METETKSPIEEEFDPVVFAKEFLKGDQGEPIELEKPIGLELVELFNSVIKLPNPQDAAIIAAFTMIPSRLCQTVPILFLKGEPGSGKSDLLEAVAQVLGLTKYGANSTGASIKNLINAIRWADPETMTYEKQYHLLLDNLEQDSFDSSSQLLSACLNGYKRNTDIQFISQGNGKNIEFRTFGPKAFTTVWDFDSKELARRSLIIHTKKYQDLDGYTLDQPKIPSIRAVVSKYWNQQVNCLNFVTLRRQTKFSKGEIPLNKEKFDLVVDMVVAGAVSGVWTSTLEGFQNLADFFLAANKRTTKLDAVILEALEKLSGAPSSHWHEIPTSVKVDIQPKSIKAAVEAAVDAGIFKKPKLEQIQETVLKLGFAMAPGQGGGIVYRMTKEARSKK